LWISTNIWAIGPNGAFYQYNESTWSTIPTGTGTETLVCVASDETAWEIAYTQGLYFYTLIARGDFPSTLVGTIITIGFAGTQSAPTLTVPLPLM
jgi:hypothetical protein